MAVLALISEATVCPASGATRVALVDQLSPLGLDPSPGLGSQRVRKTGHRSRGPDHLSIPGREQASSLLPHRHLSLGINPLKESHGKISESNTVLSQELALAQIQAQAKMPGSTTQIPGKLVTSHQ